MGLSAAGLSLPVICKDQVSRGLVNKSLPCLHCCITAAVSAEFVLVYVYVCARLLEGIK